MITDLAVPDRECHICKSQTTFICHILLLEGVHVTIPLCINHAPSTIEVEVVEDGKIFKTFLEPYELRAYRMGLEPNELYELGNEDAITILNKMIGTKNAHKLHGDNRDGH